MRVWALDDERLLEIARDRVTRTLTEDGMPALPTAILLRRWLGVNTILNE